MVKYLQKINVFPCLCQIEMDVT